MTTFKSIRGFKGYKVGDNGTVWSRRPKNGKGSLLDDYRRLRGTPTGHMGYLRVALCRADGRPTPRYIHQLVLEAFVGPCPPGKECRHLDGNHLNNRVGNLRWGTRQENHDDMARHGTRHIARGEQASGHRPDGLTEKDVRSIRRRAAEGPKGIQAIMAAEYGVSRPYISNIVSRKKWKHVV